MHNKTSLLIVVIIELENIKSVHLLKGNWALYLLCITSYCLNKMNKIPFLERVIYSYDALGWHLWQGICTPNYLWLDLSFSLKWVSQVGYCFLWGPTLCSWYFQNVIFIHTIFYLSKHIKLYYTLVVRLCGQS